MHIQIVTRVSLVVVVLAAGTGSASAYLDPGSGSVILQVILGGLAGLAVAGKLFWQRIVAFFTFGRGSRDRDE